MTYADYLTKRRNGFKPPTGAGRCRACAFHIETQGHRDGCPEINQPKGRK